MCRPCGVSHTAGSVVSTTEIFLIAMIVILAVPYAVWRLARTDYYAPLVVPEVRFVAIVVLPRGACADPAGSVTPQGLS